MFARPIRVGTKIRHRGVGLIGKLHFQRDGDTTIFLTDYTILKNYIKKNRKNLALYLKSKELNGYIFVTFFLLSHKFVIMADYTHLHRSKM